MNFQPVLSVSSARHPPFETIKPHLLSILAIALSSSAILTPSARSQVRGGYETFTSGNNADSWGLYDYSDWEFYIPGWDFSQIGNPEIYGYVRPNWSIALFADSLSSDASFVGDFSAEKISGLNCDAYVDDAISLLGADFYFVSDGIFYFSIVFGYPDYLAEDGWDYMETSFKNDPWYVFRNGGFVEVEITNVILSSITEVGVEFFSTSDAPADIIVAIDNFSLIPEVIVPKISIARNGGNIELGFERETGQIYDIQRSSNLKNWAKLPGYSGITGEGTFIATDSITERKFFKLGTEAFFTPIPDIIPPVT